MQSLLASEQIQRFHGLFGETDNPAGRELAHRQNDRSIVAVAITTNVIAEFNSAIHHSKKLRYPGQARVSRQP